MPCYHPLKRFVIGVDKYADRDIVRITPAFIGKDGFKSEVRFLVKGERDPDWRPWTSSSLVPERLSAVSGQIIPCGHCVGCQIDKSREWANRCLLELQQHDSAYFVTLTYDDAHVPTTYTPAGTPVHTLVKRDFQLFMKRLRKRVAPVRLRYFACGEYGGQTFRPHFHAIIFGLQLNDLVPYSKNGRGDILYLSDFLTSCWARPADGVRQTCVTPLSERFVPFGRVLVSPVSYATCAYTARYTTKKLYGKEGKFYERMGIEPPSLLMSRHPGIGAGYYEAHPEMLDYAFVSVSTEDGGKKFRPPKYFEKFLEEQMSEVEWHDLKLERQLAAREVQLAKQTQTSQPYGDYLLDQERQLINRTKNLKRSTV